MLTPYTPKACPAWLKFWSLGPSKTGRKLVGDRGFLTLTDFTTHAPRCTREQEVHT